MLALTPRLPTACGFPVRCWSWRWMFRRRVIGGLRCTRGRRWRFAARTAGGLRRFRFWCLCLRSFRRWRFGFRRFRSGGCFGWWCTAVTVIIVQPGLATVPEIPGIWVCHDVVRVPKPIEPLCTHCVIHIGMIRLVRMIFKHSVTERLLKLRCLALVVTPNKS